MENKLYIIGIDIPLKELVDSIQTPLFQDIIHHFYIVEYYQDSKVYYMYSMVERQYHYVTTNEESLFRYMDNMEVNFIGNNPLGEIFSSRAMLELEAARWTADVYYTKQLMEGLIHE